MYPLRKKPSKLFSKIIIISIWVASLAFALPMGLVHTFGHVPDGEVPELSNITSNDVIKNLTSDDDEMFLQEQMLGTVKTKPFCYIDFGPNASNTTVIIFKAYT